MPVKRPITRYTSCGCCEHYHPIAFAGDCRDDANRFSAQDLDDKHGPEGWMHDDPDDPAGADPYATE
jgi:hypothetical protein